jgi:hypothetical protein
VAPSDPRVLYVGSGSPPALGRKVNNDRTQPASKTPATLLTSHLMP